MGGTEVKLFQSIEEQEKENKRRLGVDGVFQFEVHSRHDVMIPLHMWISFLLLMRKIILS